MRALSLVILLAAAIAVLPVSAADGAMSGKWNVHQSIAGNDSDQTCTFTQNGSELSGTCESAQGKLTITGKVEDTKVTWSFKTEYNGQPLTVVYAGKLEAKKLAGTVTVPEFSVDGDFSATPAQ